MHFPLKKCSLSISLGCTSQKSNTIVFFTFEADIAPSPDLNTPISYLCRNKTLEDASDRRLSLANIR